MPLIDRQDAALLLIDFQSRLMPAIDDGATAIANAQRLVQAARKFAVPILFTEENAEGLGGTLAELEPDASSVAQDDIRRLPLTGFPETTPGAS